MKKGEIVYGLLIIIVLGVVVNAQIGDRTLGDIGSQSGRLNLAGSTSGLLRLGTTATASALSVGTGTIAGSGVLAGLDVGCGASCYLAVSDGTGTVYAAADGAYGIGTFTNHTFTIRTNNTARVSTNTSGNTGFSALAGATGNTLCYDTTTQGGFNTLTTCTSLRALKDDIRPLALGTPDLMRLQPKSYTQKNDRMKRFGFIAEDVGTVHPQLASYYQGKLRGVDYDAIVALLVKTVQEQQGDIDKLKRGNRK